MIDLHRPPNAPGLTVLHGNPNKAGERCAAAAICSNPYKFPLNSRHIDIGTSYTSTFKQDGQH